MSQKPFKPAVLHRVLKFTEFIILFAVKFRNIHRGYARFVFFVSCIHKGMKMLQLQHLFPRKIIFLRNFSVKSLWTEQWSNVIKLRKVESTSDRHSLWKNYYFDFFHFYHITRKELEREIVNKEKKKKWTKKK